MTKNTWHFLAKLLLSSGATKTKSKEIGRLLRAPSWQTVLYHKARQEAQEDERDASERAADDLAQQLDDVQALLEDAERVARQLRGLDPEATGQLQNAGAIKVLLAACDQQVAALSPFDAVLCRNWLEVERVVGFLRQRLARHAAALHRPAGFADCLWQALRDLGLMMCPSALVISLRFTIWCRQRTRMVLHYTLMLQEMLLLNRLPTLWKVTFLFTLTRVS